MDVPQDGLTVGGLETFLKAGRPVMVMLQAWSESGSADWENDWDDGHFVVAIGFDKERFYFMDPSTPGQWAQVPRGEFVKRWHDVDDHKVQGTFSSVRTKHFALAFWKNQKTFDFLDTALPKMD
jgi:hypothetical protein